MIMQKPIGFFISLALLTTMAVYATTQPEESEDGHERRRRPVENGPGILATDDLFRVLAEYRELSKFRTMLMFSGWGGELAWEDGITVFAPDNAAFESLPEGMLEQLLMPAHKASLTSVLKNHFVAGRVSSVNLKHGPGITTISGNEITSSADDHLLRLQDAVLLRADVKMPHGFVHVIDRVLLASNSNHIFRIK